MSIPPEELGTILVAGAHPDDETYLTSGLMAAAVRNGQTVATVTATRGEEGSFDEERWPTATMGKAREAEMMAGLAVLGVTDHTWLDYYDGAVSEVEDAEGIAKIRAQFERLDPDSVFTFGPDGMTGHADHKTVSAWTSAAFDEVAHPGARLYHATTTPEWDEFVQRLNEFNVFMEPGTPPVTQREEVDFLYALPPDILDLKLAAIQCHTSQVEGMVQAFGEDFFRRSGAEEAFVLAAEKGSQ